MSVSQSNGRTSWLRVARARHKLSMRDVAEITGVCIGTISKIETGRTDDPTPRTKRDLAEALGYEIDELWPASGRTSNRELREWARAVKADA